MDEGAFRVVKSMRFLLAVDFYMFVFVHVPHASLKTIGRSFLQALVLCSRNLYMHNINMLAKPNLNCAVVLDLHQLNGKLTNN